MLEGWQIHEFQHSPHCGEFLSKKDDGADRTVIEKHTGSLPARFGPA
jgi:hypothetical protein